MINLPRPKQNKHRNVKVERNGIKFDSIREANRYDALCLLERSGYIQCLELQTQYELVPSVILDGRKKPPIRYRADFTYTDIKNAGMFVVEDAKSPHLKKNPAYRMKKHLMKHIHGLDILEV